MIFTVLTMAFSPHIISVELLQSPVPEIAPRVLVNGEQLLLEW